MASSMVCEVGDHQSCGGGRVRGGGICTCLCHIQLTPSADVPACRDEDPAWSASPAACYPDPPEYAHPEEPQDG